MSDCPYFNEPDELLVNGPRPVAWPLPIRVRPGTTAIYTSSLRWELQPDELVRCPLDHRHIISMRWRSLSERV